MLVPFQHWNLWEGNHLFVAMCLILLLRTRGGSRGGGGGGGPGGQEFDFENKKIYLVPQICKVGPTTIVSLSIILWSLTSH